MLLAGVPKPWSGASAAVRAAVNNNNTDMCLNLQSLPHHGHLYHYSLTQTAAGTADGLLAISPPASPSPPALRPPPLRRATESAALVPSRPLVTLRYLRAQ